MFEKNDIREVITIIIFAAALIALAAYNWIFFGGAA
jgi:hypothetical protein